MENLLLSGFSGVLVAVMILGMYLGMQLVRGRKFFGFIFGLIAILAVYRFAVAIAFYITVQLGVPNIKLVKEILIIPLLMSIAISFLFAKTEKPKRKRFKS